MSYDLMVFDGAKAPKSEKQFLKWYERQIRWEEDHDYDSVRVCSSGLRDWFLEIKGRFPPMNGEFAPDPEEFEDFDSLAADYSFGRDVIYAGFAWSAAEEAHDLAIEMAKKHGLGFFDAGGDGKIIFPDEAGPESKTWFEIFRRRR